MLDERVQGFTWQNLVRSVGLQYGRVVNLPEIDYILWECTAFPLSDLDTTRRQIANYFEESE